MRTCYYLQPTGIGICMWSVLIGICGYINKYTINMCMYCVVSCRQDVFNSVPSRPYVIMDITKGVGILTVYIIVIRSKLTLKLRFKTKKYLFIKICSSVSSTLTITSQSDCPRAQDSIHIFVYFFSAHI